MFEDSLFSSQASRPTRRTRWTMVTSVILQGLALTAFVVVPLLYPATLPLVKTSPRTIPIMLLRREPPKPDTPHVLKTPSSNTLRAPSTSSQIATITHGGTLAKAGPAFTEEAPTLPFAGGMGIGQSTFLLGGGSDTKSIAAHVISSGPIPTAKPLAISSGVSAGLLLAPIKPVYPRLAVSMRLEGTVVLTAVIDKSGHIKGLQVLSGPVALRTAAVDAVSVARYRPFLLNGETTEVVTTISVVFRMTA